MSPVEFCFKRTVALPSILIIWQLTWIIIPTVYRHSLMNRICVFQKQILLRQFLANWENIARLRRTDALIHNKQVVLSYDSAYLSQITRSHKKCVSLVVLQIQTKLRSSCVYTPLTLFGAANIITRLHVPTVSQCLLQENDGSEKPFGDKPKA